MKSIKVEVPASAANLGPGFDCLALALTLHNTFSISLSDSGIEISINGLGKDSLPRDETNMVVVAFHRLADKVGKSVQGLRIQSTNKIPPRSGLGSSASAIVAGLLAANRLLGAELASGQLLSLAADLEGHGDNAAAALFGGLVAVSHSQRGWHYLRAPLSPLKVVVVVPDVAISTDQMRSALPGSLSTQQAVSNSASLAFMLDALAHADFDQMQWASRVSFHQDARLPLIPGGEEAVSAGRAAGAAVMLAGAGPGLMALAPDHHNEIAAAMQTAFSTAGVESETFFLASRAEGARIRHQKAF